MAWFVKEEGEPWAWSSAEVWEPDQMLDYLEEVGEMYLRVVVEEFRLYPWMAQEQSFSAMETPEVIGCIKRIFRKAGWLERLVFQPASIKKPTAARCRAAGKMLPSNTGKRIHAWDASLHGWHYIMRNITC
jgi:hypothetical protein